MNMKNSKKSKPMDVNYFRLFCFDGSCQLYIIKAYVVDYTKKINNANILLLFDSFTVSSFDKRLIFCLVFFHCMDLIKLNGGYKKRRSINDPLQCETTSQRCQPNSQVLVLVVTFCEQGERLSNAAEF